MVLSMQMNLVLNLEMSLYLKMEQCTKGSGRYRTDTVMVSKYGQTGPSTKDFGRITKPMERESSGMLMGTYSMDNGRKTRRMASEYTLM